MGTTIGLTAGHNNSYYQRKKEMYSREKSRAYVREPKPKWWAKWAIIGGATVIPMVLSHWVNIGVTSLTCITIMLLMLTQIKEYPKWAILPMLVPSLSLVPQGGTLDQILLLCLVNTGVAIMVGEVVSKLWDAGYIVKTFSINILFYFLVVTNDPTDVICLVRTIVTTVLIVVLVQTLKSLILDGRIQKWLFEDK